VQAREPARFQAIRGISTKAANAAMAVALRRSIRTLRIVMGEKFKDPLKV